MIYEGATRSHLVYIVKQLTAGSVEKENLTHFALVTSDANDSKQ